MADSSFNRHRRFEDAQSRLVASLIFTFAILLPREAGLLTGGTLGIASRSTI